MYQSLIILGIVCILGAVVGGGLTAFGVQIPALHGFRIVAVLVIGAVLIVVGVKLKPAPGPTGISITTDHVGNQTAPSCPANTTVSGYITTTGGDGPVTIRLAMIPDTGSTSYSPPYTVSVHGANTYFFNTTWLFRVSTGGDFQYVETSPASDGSTVQPFSVTC